MMLAVLAIGLPIAASAQTYTTRRYVRNGRVYTQRVYKKPSFYRRHRKKVNMAVGIGGGALVGGLMKGKKGALVGGILGAGGGALFNVLQKKRQRRY